MINVIGEQDEKRKDRIGNLESFFDVLKDNYVSYNVYEEINSMVPSEFICEDRIMPCGKKKCTKWLLHKQNDTDIIDRLSLFKDKNNLVYDQLSFNNHNDCYLVWTIYKIN